MKEYLLRIVSQKEGYNPKLNVLREYLQSYVLKVMHGEGFFRTTAFLGGTALRFLYDLPRFSEDLDFSLVSKPTIDFGKLVKKIKSELLASGYDVDVVYDTDKTVYSSFIKFSGLLFEAGMSPMKSQKFSIKIDIDMNPPQGAVCQTQVVNKYFPIAFLSYEIPSLFAGKVHAVLSRSYTKGRDLFDLCWYLSKWKDLEPNFIMLHNALKQTHWQGDFPDKNSWREILRGTVESLDWNKVDQDVESFLEDARDGVIFSKENALYLLR